MTNEYKIAFVGETAVGKTAIIQRFSTNQFTTNSVSTTSATFVKKSITVNGKVIRFQIWDTAGQEMYRALAPMYYRSAAAVVIVFDVTRPKTFENVRYWANEVQQKGSAGALIVVVGNKTDLADRKVAREAAEQLSRSANAVYYECSAQAGAGVQEVFEGIAAKDLIGKEKELQIGMIEDDTPRKGCC